VLCIESFEFDIAFEWWLWQHLPCVFALWVVRKDLDATEKKRLEAAVARSLAINTGRFEAIASEYASEVLLSKDAAQNYLERFIYRFGPQEEQAIEQMARYFKPHSGTIQLVEAAV